MDIIQKYIEYCFKYGEGIDEGNSNKANKNHKELSKLYESLKKADNLNLLAPLLDDANPNVRLWASTHLLSFKHEEAELTLKKLQNEKGIVRLTAKLVLENWREGNIKL
jgi:hypothetical protein